MPTRVPPMDLTSCPTSSVHMIRGCKSGGATFDCVCWWIGCERVDRVVRTSVSDLVRVETIGGTDEALLSMIVKARSCRVFSLENSFPNISLVRSLANSTISIPWWRCWGARCQRYDFQQSVTTIPNRLVTRRKYPSSVTQCFSSFKSNCLLWLKRSTTFELPK